VDIVRIIFPRQIDIAEAHIADAVALGASIATGGKRRAGPGTFFEPTVLTGCTPDMTVMREEIFGPVVPIMKVADDEEAIRIANDSPLGLNAYVFSRNKARARALAERIEAGTIMINEVIVAYSAPEAPFGGIKNSGWGRVPFGRLTARDVPCASHQLRAFRVTAEQSARLPYTPVKYRVLRTAVRAMFKRHALFGRVADLL